LKQIGRDELPEFLIEKAEKAVEEVDLSGGKQYLESDWGLRSICDWVRHKFQLKVTPDDLAGKESEEIKSIRHAQVMKLYRDKEIEFPDKLGMARFMSDRMLMTPGGQRYDREGLYHWATQRFAAAADGFKEEEFRTQPRSRITEILLEASRRCYPGGGEEEIDAKLSEILAAAERSEAEQARELAAWMQSRFGIDVAEADLTGVTFDAAR